MREWGRVACIALFVRALSAFAVTDPAFSNLKDFPSAVRLVEIKCSGTKISAHLYLTAAHCVWDLYATGQDSEVDVGELLTIDRGEKKISYTSRVTAIEVHPLFEVVGLFDVMRQSFGETNDLAVIAVEDTNPIEPAAFSSQLPVPGLNIVIGGFGGSQSFHSAPKQISALRFGSFDTPAPNVGNAHRSQIQPGDSGGAAYVWNKDLQRYEIIGVNSQYTRADAAPEEDRVSTMARVDVTPFMMVDTPSAWEWIVERLAEDR